VSLNGNPRAFVYPLESRQLTSVRAHHRIANFGSRHQQPGNLFKLIVWNQSESSWLCAQKFHPSENCRENCRGKRREFCSVTGFSYRLVLSFMLFYTVTYWSVTIWIDLDLCEYSGHVRTNLVNKFSEHPVCNSTPALVYVIAPNCNGVRGCFGGHNFGFFRTPEGAQAHPCLRGEPYCFPL